MDYATRNLRPLEGSSRVISLRIPVQTGCGSSLLNAGALSGGEMGGHGSRSLNAGKGTPMDLRPRYPVRGVPRPPVASPFPVSRTAVNIGCVILFFVNAFRFESAK